MDEKKISIHNEETIKLFTDIFRSVIENERKEKINKRKLAITERKCKTCENVFKLDTEHFYKTNNGESFHLQCKQCYKRIRREKYKPRRRMDKWSKMAFEKRNEFLEDLKNPNITKKQITAKYDISMNTLNKWIKNNNIYNMEEEEKNEELNIIDNVEEVKTE